MRYADEQIAQGIHVMNGLLQEWHQDPVPQPAWEHVPAAMRERVLALVRGYREGMTPREAHERWVAAMAADGWRHGTVKDPAARTHPCMVSYGELPQCQRVKDEMSQAIVMVLVAAGEK